MKTLIRLITILAVSLAAMASVSGCKKDNGTPDITGEWKLDDISAITRGETYGINVYLVLSPDGVFHIWQQLQEGRYKHYTGTWTQNHKVINGVYADGKAWGIDSYVVSVSGDTLKLTAQNGSREVTTYIRTSVPEDVKAGAVEAQ